MPVAVYCWVVPLAMLVFVGVTVIDTKETVVTFSVAVFDVLPLFVAVIVVVPALTPVAKPVETLMVALLGSVDIQVEVEVMSIKVPSE